MQGNDAAYAELARRLQHGFVTGDEKLYEKVKDFGEGALIRE